MPKCISQLRARGTSPSICPQRSTGCVKHSPHFVALYCAKSASKNKRQRMTFMWEINTGGKNCYCATSKNVLLVTTVMMM